MYIYIYILIALSICYMLGRLVDGLRLGLRDAGHAHALGRIPITTIMIITTIITTIVAIIAIIIGVVKFIGIFRSPC